MADDPRAGELTTTNYHWTKPTVGASDDAWGGYLNADLDSIDSIVHGIDTRVIPPGGAIVSDTPPASPTPGMLWFDSVGGQTYVWYSDPNTSQWVLAVSAAQGPQGPQGPAGPNTLPMGVTDGSNAAAGQIGEVISSIVASPGVTLTTTTSCQHHFAFCCRLGIGMYKAKFGSPLARAAQASLQAGINNVSGGIPTGRAYSSARDFSRISLCQEGRRHSPCGLVALLWRRTATYYLVQYVTSPSELALPIGNIWARRAR